MPSPVLLQLAYSLHNVDFFSDLLLFVYSTPVSVVVVVVVVYLAADFCCCCCLVLDCSNKLVALCATTIYEFLLKLCDVDDVSVVC